MPESGTMKLLAVNLSAVFFACFISISIHAQSFAHSPAPASDSARLEMLAKKIDEQNAKIDMLSQQILKLEQQLSNARPAGTTSESTPLTTSTLAPAPAPTTSTHISTTPSPAAPANGNSHVVTRGETLTSIAKMYNVSVSELQKFNHIENDRKLQIGQTIMIPGATLPSPSDSTPPE